MIEVVDVSHRFETRSGGVDALRATHLPVRLRSRRHGSGSTVGRLAGCCEDARVDGIDDVALREGVVARMIRGVPRLSWP
jgi:hypothetical protein